MTQDEALAILRTLDYDRAKDVGESVARALEEE